MSEHSEPYAPIDPLDELVEQLLDCGAVLSQMIGHMVEFGAAGRTAPDAPPIGEIAHKLIRDVIGGVRRRHSKRDVRVAAEIVEQVTSTIAQEIYLVRPDAVDEIAPARLARGKQHVSLETGAVKVLDYARDLLFVVMATAESVTDLLSILAERIDDDAFPGEELGDVLFEMLVESARVPIEALGEEAVRSVTKVLEDVPEGIVADLKMGLELRRAADNAGS
jgi:hypothetical protein